MSRFSSFQLLNQDWGITENLFEFESAIKRFKCGYISTCDRHLTRNLLFISLKVTEKRFCKKTQLSCSDCQTWNCKTITLWSLRVECFLLFTAGFLLCDVWQDSNTLPPAFFEGTPVFGGSVKDVIYFSSIIEISQPLAHRSAIFLCSLDDYLTSKKI